MSDLNSQYLIIGNYGNDTLALIQWALEQALSEVRVLSVDTGWAAPKWHEHVARCEAWVKDMGYQVVRLTANPSFADLIKQHGHFPTPKFQWCANALKGVPILNWLDQYDASGRLQLLLGHRRMSARSKQQLPAEVAESESFDERHVIYPLINISTAERNLLLARAGFIPLNHRSLECDPCINSDVFDLSHLSPTEIDRLNALEMSIGKNMFAHLSQDLSQHNSASIIDLVKNNEEYKSFIDRKDVLENMGCGDPFACGI